MEFGVWFTSHPTAVISSYLTDDLTPVPLREHSDFTNPTQWTELIDKIDYCIITITNYKDNPGNDREIIEVVREFQNNGVDVYLAFSTLLGPSGGMFDPMEDANNIESGNWISPDDQRRARSLVDKINKFCRELNPHGILLWYATYPNEKYGYECDQCVSDITHELDIDERANVLTDFLTEVSGGIREENPDVRIAIEVDIQGGTDIKYRNGIDLEMLEGVIDDLILHVHDSQDETITRAVQMATKAHKCGISTTYYISVIDRANFERLFQSLNQTYAQDILVYSPKERVVSDVVDFFLGKKWETHIERTLFLGSAVSFLFGIYEFYMGLQWPVIGDVVPAPSIMLAAIFLILSLEVDRLPTLTQRFATTFGNRLRTLT